MIKYLANIALIVAICLPSLGAQKKWWQTWPNYPKVPRITASEVKQIVLSGQKAIFVYSGYEVREMVCGSLIITYGLVPPQADGSRVNLTGIPKDAWIFCYCP